MAEKSRTLLSRLQGPLHTMSLNLGRLRAVIAAISLLIVVLAFGLYVLSAYRELGARVERVFSINARLANHLERIQSANNQINTALVLRLAGDDEAARNLINSNLLVLKDRQESISVIRHRLSDDLGAVIDELLENLHLLQDHTHIFYEIEEQSDFEEFLIRRYAEYLSPDILKMSEMLIAAQKLNSDELMRGGGVTQEGLLTNVRLLILLLIVMAVAVLYWAYLYAFRVFRPLQQLTQAIQRLGAEKWDQPTPTFSYRELGKFARPVNLVSYRMEEFKKAQREEVERAQRTLEASMASLAQPLFVTDPDGLILFLNPAARRFLNAVGVDQDAPGLPMELMETIEKAKSNDGDLSPRDLKRSIPFTISESEHYFLPQVTRLAQAGHDPFGFTLLLEDVTDMRLIDELRAGMISMIGHELKTPMTVIRMALYLLQQNALDRLSAEHQDLLLSAIEDTETLNTTLQNLLDLSQMDAGGIALRKRPWQVKRDLPPAIQKFCKLHKIPPTSVEVEIEPDLPEIELDPERMDHAFLNLLSNAVKFSPAGGVVKVRASQYSSKWIRISVADAGPGIPEAYRERLFEPFFRVPGQGVSGAGVGLSIVERLVRMHGGRIFVESEVAVGTVFMIDLPAQGKEEKSPGA